MVEATSVVVAVHMAQVEVAFKRDVVLLGSTRMAILLWILPMATGLEAEGEEDLVEARCWAGLSTTTGEIPIRELAPDPVSSLVRLYSKPLLVAWPPEMPWLKDLARD